MRSIFALLLLSFLFIALFALVAFPVYSHFAPIFGLPTLSYWEVVTLVFFLK